MSAVDSDTNVHPGHHQEGGKSEARELHLVPVWDDIGEVGGYQGVNPATGSGKINIRVCDGHQQWAGQNTARKYFGKLLFGNL